MDQTHADVIIVGGGTAGLSAAQTLGRSLRRTIVIDSGSPRNRFAAHMHNVLGHDGATPESLLERGRAEAAAYGVEFVEGSVVRVRDAGDRLAIEFAPLTEGSASETLTARALVIATGVRDDLPAIPGLSDYWGSSVLHCPYCHGWEVRGSRIAVLATSPASLHQVKLARQWSDDVTVFSAELGPLDPTAERSLLARGMRIVSAPVTEILGDGTGVTGVRTADGLSHEIDAILTASTMVPFDGFIADLDLARTEAPHGSFLTVDGFGRTSHQRVWAVGNVAAPMATVPMAMGSGAAAGGSVNFALVEEDFTVALSKEHDD